MTPTDEPERRLSSDERRSQIIVAALAVFGAKGYVGATTDDVARAASVSQPYVVRLFGSKENLFVAACTAALDQLLAGFRAAAEVTNDTLEHRLGRAYIDLLEVRGLHQTLTHAFLLGAHPVIGPVARDGFAQVWEYLRSLGFTAEQAQGFLAHGMLINTMIGMRLADDYDVDSRVTELFDACFPADKARVLGLAPRVDEAW
ncbi:HTH-type transcriptional regulator BetI [Microbacterium ginsengisoli]|uniref:HTH-type transcriptional regulator BetI n=1 Tax=Microbacterium ginsengisoli TaxID=400772 RepID=A0A0F0M292_9MICO|nr:TetR/AcrR family transcriptional regulator [Microbacterium ginsengisoli]KJL38839.1 HTH-type transcriptional regulator BetI [Microbacterium ginsengisoli]MBN9207878.1 TetR/AcrR family transcriptional regulator [Microbacterium ginsengisoli]